MELLVLEFIRKLIINTKYENKIYLAGGAVRDKIMGLPAKDIDLLINMPKGGIKFAEWICKKTNCFSDTNPIIFPKFGTAKFNFRNISGFENIDIECVMPRTEKYKFGDRHPEVKFSTLKEDVLRRDLTINSLLMNISTNEILDLTELGISDIKNGIIRTPLNPNKTFIDDPLRMIRLIRFAVRYNWNIPLYILKSIKRNSYMLEHISVERINVEFTKILISNFPDKGIRLLMITNLMKYIIPELYLIKGMKQNVYHDFDVLGHTLRVLQKTKPIIENRLSALLHDIGKINTKTIDENGKTHFYGHEDSSGILSKEILFRLKYPNDIIDKVFITVTNHMRTKCFLNYFNASDRIVRELKNDLGDNLDLLLDVIDADNKSHGVNSNMPNQVEIILKRIENLPEKKQIIKPPITGFDIMNEFNLPPSEKIGEIKKIAENIFLENPNITKIELINKLKEIIK